MTLASSSLAARLKGYEGEACKGCGSFTLVRNGVCLKCDTCGETSGCSEMKTMADISIRPSSHEWTGLANTTMVNETLPHQGCGGMEIAATRSVNPWISVFDDLVAARGTLMARSPTSEEELKKCRLLLQ